MFRFPQCAVDLADFPFEVPLVADIFHAGFPAQAGIKLDRRDGLLGISDFLCSQLFELFEDSQHLVLVTGGLQFSIQQPPVLDMQRSQDGMQDIFPKSD